MSTLTTVNPATGNVINTYEEMSEQALNDTVDEVYSAFETWKTTSFATRRTHMQNAAKVLRTNANTYAKLMTEEMGKPFTSGLSEIEKCAMTCAFYAEHAEKFLSPEIITTDAYKSYVMFAPLGVVLGIMPWNFPFWQVFRFVIPSLMAGNTCLLKHASNTMGCALAIESIFRDAGFPDGVFRTLVTGSHAMEGIISNKKVAAVTFTGSTEVGRKIGQMAGASLKKSVLELGGSDPYIVLADADLELSADLCVASRLTNSGQSCIAAKRFIVIASVADVFQKHVVAKMKAAKMGDPMKSETEVGPQARMDLREALHKQVTRSVELGASCVLGGTIPKLPGAYYPPTVLTDVKPGMPAFEEELFGPVAAIITAEDDEEAFAIANGTGFGLGAAVFTQNRQRGEELAANKLVAGSCFVNTQVKSDPRLPFGGVKESGYGRELSHFGIREFVNIKTVVVN